LVRRFKIVTYSGESLEVETYEDKDFVIVKYSNINREFRVRVTKISDEEYVVNIDGFDHRVRVKDGTILIDSEQSLIQRISETISSTKLRMPKIEEKRLVVKGEITAPISGVITEIKVNIGDYVKENDVVALLFSMKMIVEIKSNISGYVSEIYVKPGQAVKANQPIIKITPIEKRS